MSRSALVCLSMMAAPMGAAAQDAGIHTYANPLDIEYRYAPPGQHAGRSFREGADPVILYHDGGYYLFVTRSGGYWRSDDMLHWKFITPSVWPPDDMVAPAAIVVRDTMYIMQSSYEARSPYRTTDPASGALTRMPPLPPIPGAAPPGTDPPEAGSTIPPGPWDPALFHDDSTDRWFLYWGSSNVYPVYGIELKKQGDRFEFIGKPRPIIAMHPDRHGWERFGPNHTDSSIAPYVEGAWMTRHRGRYYLQYAAPGTEYNGYANGVYLGDSPLGPFHYAPYNPVSYKPGGFVIGAGHGNTFVDRFGNYWNTGTNWLGVNWRFERRVVMFPAGFDDDGVMFSNTRFGDLPHYLPTRRWQSPDELFTGWMLLSYRKRATASSVTDSFAPANVTDENPRTFWVAGANRPGEWLELDLGGPRTVRALQVNFADYQSDRYAEDPREPTRFTVQGSLDGRTWTVLADLSHETRDRPNPYIELPEPAHIRYVKYVHEHVGAATLAISDLRIFGSAEGTPPALPGNLHVVRDDAGREAVVTWTPVAGATGYNIRWGIAPDKLYQTYQVWNDQPQPLRIRALTAGQDYVFAIEAFNESGVSGLQGEQGEQGEQD